MSLSNERNDDTDVGHKMIQHIVVGELIPCLYVESLYTGR